MFKLYCDIGIMGFQLPSIDLNKHQQTLNVYFRHEISGKYVFVSLCTECYLENIDTLEISGETGPIVFIFILFSVFKSNMYFANYSPCFDLLYCRT